MRFVFDTSVLIDYLRDPNDIAADALFVAAQRGRALVCLTSLMELWTHQGKNSAEIEREVEAIRQLCDSLGIAIVAPSQRSQVVALDILKQFRSKLGKSGLQDSLILGVGATRRACLVTRDEKWFRLGRKDLRVVSPTELVKLVIDGEVQLEMSKNLLVATLGTSPAVVTEAIDLLAEQGIPLDGVILFTTEDHDVRESLALLSEHLPRFKGLNWVQSVPIAAHEDIRTSEAAVEFMEEACRILKTYRDNGDRLFVCIAGGRKAMSFLLALAVQFYGAERLFHIWAPPWMEAEGEIGKLRHLRPEQLNERLHPSLSASDADRPHIVDLPFLGLFPLLGDILDALKGQSIPPPRDVRQMLTASGLLTREGAPTLLGKRVAAILENVEGLPPARQDECKVHIAKHHCQDKLKQFAEELRVWFPFVTEIHTEEWRQGDEQVKAQPPNAIIVGSRLGTDILFRLRLVTTATNPGQLEAARRAIEQRIRRAR